MDKEKLSRSAALGIIGLAGLGIYYELYVRPILFPLTNIFHSNRAEIHACFNGINALSMPAEDIITSRFPGRKSELDLFYQSQPLDQIEKRERIAIAFSLFDPTGYIQTMAKELGFSP
ncbi:hypothetical protein A2W14_00840 [Candidatus Gottesmanbacteria bacterium RBG_16_37_8]|uniref:Uncharacterized protein n=1 Tax=Candidatus Gottesmanbacteria bacterium RBG_16_37_8 TaxID=1798371 RepID=A0A1F5YV79_9BACT|nr:MAG: hypothetical protein A2W14_00840 [Candidatus Gottesmanbacteria bacterium RBG_16_37_8]